MWPFRRRPKQMPVGKTFVRWIEWGKCPDCGAKDMWSYDQTWGGSRDITCRRCGAKFNVVGEPLNLIERRE